MRQYYYQNLMRLMLIGISLLLPLRLLAATPRATVQKPLVVAHFMHQMSIGAEHGAGEGMFAAAPSTVNGVMAHHIDEYLVNYRHPYDAARQDIAYAKNCGIDAFTLLLSASHLPASQFANTIKAYYQVACERGDFYLAPDIWEGNLTEANVTKLANALRLLKDNYDAAWLRFHGKRVVLMFPSMPFAEFDTKVLSVLGGIDNVYLITYGYPKDPAWAQHASGFTNWHAHVGYGEESSLRDLEWQTAQVTGVDYWQPVSPAFQQSRSWPKTFMPNVREKLGMTAFTQAWEQAIAHQAPGVFLQTWNDLTEDMAVMPETNHGFAYYDLTTFYAQWFHTGKQPPITKDTLLVFHHPQLVNGMQLPPGRKPMPTFAWISTPPTDYVGVVSFLTQPATVTVSLGEKVLAQRECPAGFSKWLIYNPGTLAPNEFGKRTPVYPIANAALAITTLDKPLWDAELYLAVTRQQRRLGVFRSHRPIVEAAGRGDLCTIGDVFNIPPQ